MSINSTDFSKSAKIKFASFTASGTWTAPLGVTTIFVLGVGGGGAGGGSKSNNNSHHGLGGGGGGGGVFDGSVAVTPGTTYTVTIGSGGVSATAATLASGNGGNTSFGSIITCPGGQAGVSISTATSTSASTVTKTNNPGGSFGGSAAWSNRGNVEYTQGQHGGGASLPSEFAYIHSSTISALSLRGTNYIKTYNNGYGTASTPYAVIDPAFATSVGYSANTFSIFPNTLTQVLTLSYIKRGRSLTNAFPFVIARPGDGWKNLGAGGAGHWYPTNSTIGSNTSGDFTLVPTTSGYCSSTGVETNTFDMQGDSTSYPGVAAASNSGSGGGGSLCYNNLTYAPGGNGGSGYLEITWQE